jgi:hypothetical protein
MILSPFSDQLQSDSALRQGDHDALVQSFFGRTGRRVGDAPIKRGLALVDRSLLLAVAVRADLRCTWAACTTGAACTACSACTTGSAGAACSACAQYFTEGLTDCIALLWCRVYHRAATGAACARYFAAISRVAKREYL